MVMGNLPLSIFVYVDKGVTSFDLLSCSPHGELIDSAVLRPVDSLHNVTLENLTLWFELQEVGEVVFDAIVIYTKV